MSRVQTHTATHDEWAYQFNIRTHLMLIQPEPECPYNLLLADQIDRTTDMVKLAGSCDIHAGEEDALAVLTSDAALEDEREWNRVFASASREKILAMSERARQQRREGKVRPLNINEL